MALENVNATLDAALARADESGTTIAEIVVDLDDLIAKLAAGTPGSAEVADAEAKATALTAKLDATADALKSAAGKHTPSSGEPPTDPTARRR